MKEFDGTVVSLGKVVFRNEGMAKLLKGSPELRVIVGGHMDSTGDRECNMGLSRRRAGAFGIAPSPMVLAGIGMLTSAMSNRMEDGRVQNRRVELAEM